MLAINKDQIKKILIDELGYSKASAETFLEDFPPIHDKLSGAVNHWLEDRTVEDLNLYGLTIKEMMKTHGYNFILTIKILNRLLDEDLTEERRQRLAEDLKKPFPRW